MNNVGYSTLGPQRLEAADRAGHIRVMMLFLFLAAVLAAGAAALIIGRAVVVGRGADGPDPTEAVYLRQLEEVDDLAARGLLDEPDRRQAFAEAARRLLSTQQAAEGPAPAPSRSAGRIVTLAAGAAAAAAVVLYMLVGAPGTPDAPFKARLAQWRAADPQTLGPAPMAAVLSDLASRHPNDATLAAYLGSARLAAGDGYGAIEALRHAVRLEPRNVQTLVLLGQAQASLEADQVSPEAEATFRRALALEPANPAARYALAKAQILRGDTASGVAGLRALRESLAAGDPRRAMLDDQIAQAGQSAPPAAEDPQAAMIRGMVAGLAERLKQSPDDAPGWARLVRSYGVLGDGARQRQALAEARMIFAGRPKELAIVEAEAPR